MSYIKPSEYKVIAEQLGTAYGDIRDAINDGANGGAVSNMGTAMDTIAAADDTLEGNATVDPKGSIMNDLGVTWFKATNQDFTVARAKSTASALFSAALRKLNSHVIKRMGMTSIATYYSTYAFIPGDTSMSLFNTPESPDYFSADFEDLSSKIGVTIDTDYIDA